MELMTEIFYGAPRSCPCLDSWKLQRRLDVIGAHIDAKAAVDHYKSFKCPVKGAERH